MPDNQDWIRMNVTMKKVLCLAVMALSACTPVHKSGLTLHYDRPAEFFEEALPIGNGRIGAMVYGAASRTRARSIRI